jgi:hypothetical protein
VWLPCCIFTLSVIYSFRISLYTLPHLVWSKIMQDHKIFNPDSTKRNQFLHRLLSPVLNNNFSSWKHVFRAVAVSGFDYYDYILYLLLLFFFRFSFSTNWAATGSLLKIYERYTNYRFSQTYLRKIKKVLCFLSFIRLQYRW